MEGGGSDTSYILSTGLVLTVLGGLIAVIWCRRCPKIKALRTTTSPDVPLRELTARHREEGEAHVVMSIMHDHLAEDKEDEEDRLREERKLERQRQPFDILKCAPSHVRRELEIKKEREWLIMRRRKRDEKRRERENTERDKWEEVSISYASAAEEEEQVPLLVQVHRRDSSPVTTPTPTSYSPPPPSSLTQSDVLARAVNSALYQLHNIVEEYQEEEEGHLRDTPPPPTPPPPPTTPTTPSSNSDEAASSLPSPPSIIEQYNLLLPTDVGIQERIDAALNQLYDIVEDGAS